MENNISEKKKYNNEYSIYDYLKNNTAILLAVISGIVAIVTFFAKYITFVSARKELAFWGFDISYATFGTESIIYTVIFSIVYSVFTSVILLIFSNIYEEYLPYEKCHVLLKIYIREKNNEIKRTRKITERKLTVKQKKEIKQNFKDIRKNTKEIINCLSKKFIFWWGLIFILICGNSILFVNVAIDYTNYNVLNVVGVLIILHLISLLVYKNILKNKALNTKEIKEECIEKEFLESLKEQTKREVHENTIFRSGIRAIMSNSTILYLVSLIVFNCFFVLLFVCFY